MDALSARSRSAVDGIGSAQLKRALGEAAAAVGGSLAVTSLAVGVATSSLDAADLGAADAVRLGMLGVGLAALGSVGASAELGEGAAVGVGLTASITVVPLAITALLVGGWAVAARRGASAVGVKRSVQAAALSGLASGALLALLSAASRITSASGLGVDNAVVDALSVSIGVGAVRVFFTGTLMAGGTATLVRLWPQVRAGLAGGRLIRRVAPWMAPLALVCWFAVVAAVLAVAVAVILVLVSDNRPENLNGWVAVVVALPTLALLAVMLATGATLGISGTTGGGLLSDLGQLDDLWRLLDLGAVEDLSGTFGARYGLLEGSVDAKVWWGLAVVVVTAVVVGTSVRLRSDPRSEHRGLWWRTGVLGAAAWLGIALVTRGGLSIDLLPVRLSLGALDITADAESLSANLVTTAGPTLFSSIVAGFAVGAALAIAFTLATRPLAATLPRLMMHSRRLPGGLHPLWSLLLVDASARLGMTAPDDQRAAAARAAGAAEGLEQLSVDRRRSGIVVVAAVVAVLAGIVLPVAHHVLSTTVFGPEAAARSFAQAFEDADAEVVRSAAGSPRQATLSDEALAYQRRLAPISGVIVSVDAESDATASATIRYKVSQTNEHLDLTLTRSADERWGGFPRWDVSTSLPSLNVSVPTVAQTVSVNGVVVDEEDLASHPLTVFPGAYSVQASAPSNFEVAGQSGLARTSESSDVTLTMSLTPAVMTAARKAVDDWLVGCQASKSLSPPGCPLSAYSWSEGISNVRWAYAPSSSTSASYDMTPLGAVSVAGTAKGTYSYDYTLTGSLDGSTTRHDEDDIAAGYDGDVTFDDEGGATFEPS